jgi:hypothetical protein
VEVAGIIESIVFRVHSRTRVDTASPNYETYWLSTCFAFLDDLTAKKEGFAMADVIYTVEEREGLSDKDRELLHQHVLHHIQTSQEIRKIISEQRKKFVEMDSRIKEILRKKADPLRKRLKQQARTK